MSTIPQFARFWMICRKPDGPRAKTEPRARYSHLKDARNDAARLARDTGHPFVILEAVETIRPDATPDQEALL